MERAWHASYPPGMPTQIDPDAFASVNDLMEDAFARHGRRDFARCLGHTMRYDMLDRLSRAFAGWLRRRGVLPGARVAVMLPNLSSFPFTVVGALRAGCTIVTINPLYTPRELQHQLADSGAEAIVVLENFAGTLAQVIGQTAVRHVVVATSGDLLGFPRGALVNHVVRRVKRLVPAYDLPGAVPLGRALGEGRHHPWTPVARAPGDVAFLQYTGGTTGVSKGAMLTHRNVVAAVMQANAAIDAGLAWRGVTLPQLHVIAALPLYHIYGLTGCLLIGMHRGNLLTLIPNPRDIPALVKALSERPFHMFPGLNTLFVALMNDEKFRALDLSSLLFTQAGGMATMPAVAERWQKMTGCAIAEGWGMSETAAIGTNTPVGETVHTGSIGVPLPSIDLVVRDDDNRDVPVGTPGELCIRGPNVTPGYYNRPDETARALTPDGYFRTGDIGTMDARGFFRIVDRKKDMILVSGFNVFPTEIEAVVSAHPQVLECAAVGVPDPGSGEAVRLYVVARDPALTEQQVRDWCRERLTGYKRPSSIVFATELPKTPVGKVLRRALRDTGTSAPAAAPPARP